jgi:hypothetical protein
MTTHHSSRASFEPRQLRYNPLTSMATTCTSSVVPTTIARLDNGAPGVNSIATSAAATMAAASDRRYAKSTTERWERKRRGSLPDTGRDWGEGAVATAGNWTGAQSRALANLGLGEGFAGTTAAARANVHCRREDTTGKMGAFGVGLGELPASSGHRTNRGLNGQGRQGNAGRFATKHTKHAKNNGKNQRTQRYSPLLFSLLRVFRGKKFFT